MALCAVYTFIMIRLMETFFLQFVVHAKVLCNMLSSYLPNLCPGWKLTGNGNEKGRIGFSLPLALDHYGILLELPKTILKELE
jgi:hypothetical protein